MTTRKKKERLKGERAITAIEAESDWSDTSMAKMAVLIGNFKQQIHEALMCFQCMQISVAFNSNCNVKASFIDRVVYLCHLKLCKFSNRVMIEC